MEVEAAGDSIDVKDFPGEKKVWDQAAFDPIYPRLAEKYGVALYPFFLDGVAADRAYLLEDGMHPNAAGIDRMVENMLPVVEKVIAAHPGDA